jgi:hypothetical protein
MVELLRTSNSRKVFDKKQKGATEKRSGSNLSSSTLSTKFEPI